MLAADMRQLPHAEAVLPQVGVRPTTASLSTAAQLALTDAAQLPEHADVADEQRRHQNGAKDDRDNEQCTDFTLHDGFVVGLADTHITGG